MKKYGLMRARLPKVRLKHLAAAYRLRRACEDSYREIGRDDALDFDIAFPRIAKIITVMEGLAPHSLDRLSRGCFAGIMRAIKAIRWIGVPKPV